MNRILPLRTAEQRRPPRNERDARDDLSMAVRVAAKRIAPAPKPLPLSRRYDLAILRALLAANVIVWTVYFWGR